MVSGKNSGGEKWRKSWTHLPRHPRNNTSHHWPLHRIKEGIFIAITMFSRGLGALREQRPPLREQGGEQGGEPRGARWGAGWGNPGSKVGSRVGNPGEQGGEQCGGTPSGSHNTTEQGISGGPNGTSQPVFATITCDISKWGAPVSRRAPLRQLCAYDVSRCPCDYPSVVPDPG